MPARFGAVAMSLLAVIVSFAIVYGLGRPLVTAGPGRTEPTASPDETRTTAPHSAGPVTVHVDVDTGRLDPEGARQPIPGGYVWLDVANGDKPSSDSASREGSRLCLQIPADWRPAGSSWHETDQSDVSCQPIEEEQVITVELGWRDE